MPYPPRSAPWCWRCGCDDSDDDDGRPLFAVYLSRPHLAADGRRRTRTIPIRVCRPCVEVALEANAKSSGRIRPDLLEPSRPRAPRVRNPGGTYATRAQMATLGPLAAAGRDG